MSEPFFIIEMPEFAEIEVLELLDTSAPPENKASAE